MNKPMRFLTSALLAGFFSLSLLSNCYCSPALSAQKPEPAAKSHCEHHQSKAGKTQECSARYNTDQFEQGTAFASISTPSVVHLGAVLSTGTFDPPRFSFLSFNPVSQTGPPPHFYLLHHSYLI